jgi:hypothetical protein
MKMKNELLTESGSPPKYNMYLLIHFNAVTISKRPMFPDAESSSRHKNPINRGHLVELINVSVFIL